MPDSVGKCPPGFSEEVEARAVKDAANAISVAQTGLPGSIAYRLDAESAVRAAAPVIAEAAYRAGIAEVWKAIEAEADRYGKQAQMLNSPDSEEAEAVLRDMLSKLKSAAALTDTEGRGPGSIEGRQEPPAATTDSVVNTNPEGGEN